MTRAHRLALLAASAAVAGAVSGQLQVPQKASFELFADRTAYPPGATVQVAAKVRIEDRWHVNSNTPTLDYLIPTELTLELPEGASPARLTYPEAKLLKFEFAPQPVAVYEGEVTIRGTFDLPADVAPGSLEVPARLRYQACDDKQCLPPTTTEQTLVLHVGDGGSLAHPEIFAAAGAASAAGVPAAAAGAGRLAVMLVLALIGGLILNAMPCVLPVLSLKIFGMMKSAEQGRSHLVVGSLATTAGILASFWLLAGLTVAAKAAGATVGWGVHFQQPGFVAFLAVVMVLFALNMWGVFEIPLPRALAQAGGSGREGIPGHFASGLLATLMATPCSAPFLGTAVGFALAQSAATIFAVFTAVGVGLALPYLLLAAVPAAGRLLPRPGPWMVTLRGVLGFFLAAAAVWLLYVLGAQVDAAHLFFVELTIVALALLVWLAGHLQRRGVRRALTAAGAAVALMAVALAAGAGPPSRS
ncbi:MAG: hypothetical protein D6696_00925, partial [Acidobacteria bacterium]